MTPNVVVLAFALLKKLKNSQRPAPKVAVHLVKTPSTTGVPIRTSSSAVLLVLLFMLNLMVVVILTNHEAEQVLHLPP